VKTLKPQIVWGFFIVDACFSFLCLPGRLSWGIASYSSPGAREGLPHLPVLYRAIASQFPQYDRTHKHSTASFRAAAKKLIKSFQEFIPYNVSLRSGANAASAIRFMISF